jgi:hypothetical protein
MTTNPFSDDLNPYAPPAIVAEQVFATPAVALYRDGNTLVMHRHAKLPPRCIKSNAPTSRYLKRDLRWAPSWVLLLLLVNLLICLIVMLIVQKTAKIDIGLSDEWFARRRFRIALAWIGSLASVVLFVVGIVLLDGSNSAVGPLLMLGSVILFLTAALFGAFGARMVYAKKIDDHYIWLRGACPEYLEGLPQFPG